MNFIVAFIITCFLGILYFIGNIELEHGPPLPPIVKAPETPKEPDQPKERVQFAEYKHVREFSPNDQFIEYKSKV
jgi:hypothetical protein